MSLRSVIILQIIVCVFSKSLSPHETVNSTIYGPDNDFIRFYTYFIYILISIHEMQIYFFSIIIFFRIKLIKTDRGSYRNGKETHSRTRRSSDFGNSIFGDDFGFDSIFDPMDDFVPKLSDGFSFDMPFPFPPLDPLWPLNLPQSKLHFPGVNDIFGHNGFGNPWNNNPIVIENMPPSNPPTSKPPVSNNGHQVHLRNFNDVNYVWFLCVFLTFKFIKTIKCILHRRHMSVQFQLVMRIISNLFWSFLILAHPIYGCHQAVAHLNFVVRLTLFPVGLNFDITCHIFHLFRRTQ